MTRPAALVPACLALCAALLAPSTAAAQVATLDVLDGETLYEGGWLVTLSRETETRNELRSGNHRIPDALRREAVFRDTALAAHHGLRHDLQLSLIVPRTDRSLRVRPVGGPAVRLSAEGLGDVVALAKWRVHRWDAPHKALNVSLIGGLEMPTGEDDETDGGLRLPPDLQPGRGSWNPLLGAAATYEPGRWRFNAVALYAHGGGGGAEETGNRLFGELAVGHRFWLEPYPGPFMRADLALRHQRDERIRVRDDFLAGPPLANDPARRAVGGELTSLALNWAFRPRPSLDFQVEVETPLSQHVHGSDLRAETTLSVRFGYRF